jgi:hypothetical protein
METKPHRGPRPKKPRTDGQSVTFRADQDLVTRLDALADYECHLRPGVPFNRSDMIKMLLAEALAARAARKQ